MEKYFSIQNILLYICQRSTGYSSAGLYICVHITDVLALCSIVCDLQWLLGERDAFQLSFKGAYIHIRSMYGISFQYYSPCPKMNNRINIKRHQIQYLHSSINTVLYPYFIARLSHTDALTAAEVCETLSSKGITNAQKISCTEERRLSKVRQSTALKPIHDWLTNGHRGTAVNGTLNDL